MCLIPFRPRTLLYGKPVSLIFNVNHCPNENTSVEFLEHVEIETTIKYTNRGALQMYLTSPHGKILFLYFNPHPLSLYFR